MRLKIIELNYQGIFLIHYRRLFSIMIFVILAFQTFKINAQDVVLQDMSIDTKTTFVAADNIIVGPNFSILSNGDATLNAQKVFVRPTSSVMRGGKLQVISRSTAVNIKLNDLTIPNLTVLHQNFPNPFNPNTTIKYSIHKQSNVILRVFDVLGSKVANLVNKEQPQGNYEVEYDGTELTSGIYFYQLNAGDYTETKKMILIK